MGLFGVTASSEFGGSDMTYLDQVGIVSSEKYIRKAAWADLDQDGPLPNNIEPVKMFFGNYL